MGRRIFYALTSLLVLLLSTRPPLPPSVRPMLSAAVEDERGVEKPLGPPADPAPPTGDAAGMTLLRNRDEPTAPQILAERGVYDLVPAGMTAGDLRGWKGAERAVVVRARDCFGAEPAALSYVIRAYSHGAPPGKGGGRYLKGVEVLPRQASYWTTYHVALAFDVAALPPSAGPDGPVARMLLTIRTRVRYLLGYEETLVQHVVLDGGGLLDVLEAPRR